jgi:hypothetical protein
VRASIPLTAVSTQGTSLEVEELMLTIRPQPEEPGRQPGARAPSSPSQDADGFLSLEDIGLGQATVMEGIKRIAGGIEKLLQQLTVVARGTTVRVELPPTAACAQESVVLLRAGAVSYHDATPEAAGPDAAPAGGAPVEMVKVFDVQGFAVELYEASDDAAALASPRGQQGQQPAAAELAQSRLLMMSSAAVDESESSEACLAGWELEVARQARGLGEQQQQQQQQQPLGGAAPLPARPPAAGGAAARLAPSAGRRLLLAPPRPLLRARPLPSPPAYSHGRAGAGGRPRTQRLLC